MGNLFIFNQNNNSLNQVFRYCKTEKQYSKRAESLIQSVYFDTQDGKLQLYHDRMQKNEGSKAVRVRW